MFYKDLTSKERINLTMDLFRQYENGEIDKAELGDKVYRLNGPLIGYVVKKYSNIPKDDVESLCGIGLTKAMNTFKTDKGTNFATYSMRCMLNEVNMSYRKILKDRGWIAGSLEDVLAVDNDGSQLLLEDILYVGAKQEIGFDADSIDYTDVEPLIKKSIERVTKNEVLRGSLVVYYESRFFWDKPLTQVDLAKRTGMPQSYMSRLMLKVEKVLRPMLYKYGILEEAI